MYLSKSGGAGGSSCVLPRAFPARWASDRYKFAMCALPAVEYMVMFWSSVFSFQCVIENPQAKALAVETVQTVMGSLMALVMENSNNVLDIVVKDKGVGIPDITQAMQPMYTTDTKTERAGLGFAVMLTFMDKVKVYSTPGKGTRVVMTKNIG